MILYHCILSMHCHINIRHRSLLSVCGVHVRMCAKSSMILYVNYSMGCYSHKISATICDLGQNQSQQSIRNICHRQQSSHYLFDICCKIGQGQGEILALKPRTVIPMLCNDKSFRSRSVKAF